MKINHRNLLLALALGVACGDPPTDLQSNAPTTFRLTDAPFPYDKVARVDVFVVRVQASWSPDTSAASGEFLPVVEVNRKVNLLELANGLSDVLGEASVPAGGINAIRLIIDTDKSSITMKTGQVLTGSSSPGIAWQSSAGIATLNATIEDRIAVPNGGTDVVIDFDVGRAFLDPADVTPPCGCAGFIFSPVLRAAEVSRTGSLTGLVRLGSPLGAAAVGATVELKIGNPNNPSNTWSTISTTSTDANGVFKFGYVTQSEFYTRTDPNRMYIVVATAGSGQGSRGATVVKGADNAAGIVVVPQS